MEFFWIAFLGMALPFLGTALGAATVFFGRSKASGDGAILDSAAAGVMTAAAVFSLLLPAVEGAAAWGRFAFLPAFTGLLLGATAIAFGTRLTGKEGRERAALTVTLHNLPEGMAVGILLSALLSGAPGVTAAGVLSVAAGIALQNVPEGAVISLPAYSEGASRRRAFLLGVGSGAVEPAGALVALLFAPLVGPLLPWLLGMAAGAMLFAVASELLNGGTGEARGLAFSLGFALMMALDVAFG